MLQSKIVPRGQTGVLGESKPSAPSDATPKSEALDKVAAVKDLDSIQTKTHDSSDDEEVKGEHEQVITKEELELKYRVYEGLMAWPRKTEHLYYA